MAQTIIRYKRQADSISMSSEAFKTGYNQASKDEYIGWPIKQVPCEELIVKFLLDTIAIVSSDLEHGSDCDYEVRWIAGLLAGWLTGTRQ